MVSSGRTAPPGWRGFGTTPRAGAPSPVRPASRRRMPDSTTGVQGSARRARRSCAGAPRRRIARISARASRLALPCAVRHPWAAARDKRPVRQGTMVPAGRAAEPRTLVPGRSHPGDGTIRSSGTSSGGTVPGGRHSAAAREGAGADERRAATADRAGPQPCAVATGQRHVGQDRVHQARDARDPAGQPRARRRAHHYPEPLRGGGRLRG